MKQGQRRLLGTVIVLVLMMGMPAFSASALAPGTDVFQRTWARTDHPVAAQGVVRTWIWGPTGFSATMYEPYEETPGGLRVVQYFDKSRMEITHPSGDQNSIWYVTNGLLVVELVSGRMQMGDHSFDEREAAQVNVAGDADDPTGPTYATMALVADEPALAEDVFITSRVDRAGNVTPYDQTAYNYQIKSAVYVLETDHTVAWPFWTFMTNSGPVFENGQLVTAPLFENPFYATGYPITEAHWASVKVGGTYKDVLMQCFERRCLTYTPSNPIEWTVEMGNVGQHYYRWRHETDVPSEPPVIEIADYQQIGPAYLSLWPSEQGGNAHLYFANQSPYQLTITLDGPVSQSITIPACPDCIVYTSPAQVMACRADLPEGEIIAPPGNYRIMMDYLGGNVVPARDHWTLIPNSIYDACYFVVQQ